MPILPRRRVVLGVTAALLVASQSLRAQPARVFRIGVLRPTASEIKGDDILTSCLPRALRELGYVDGRNLKIDVRFADNNLKRLPALAQELVAGGVDAIFAVDSAAVRAARAATTTIPIVFFGYFDPVKLGFVKSLAQPGGNATGVVIEPDANLIAKQVELLAQAAPGAKRMAMLLPEDPYEAGVQAPEARKTASRLGIDVFGVVVRDGDYRAAFERIEQARVQSLLVASSDSLLRERQRIIDFARRSKLPAMYEWPDQADDGGLMAYGPTGQRAICARLAADLDRVLKGASAGDLPVEQLTKLELVINVRTAKAIGITIPQAVLARADRVIE